MVRGNALDELGLDGELLAKRFEMMANLVPKALNDVLDESASFPGMEKIAPAFLSEVTANCRRSCERMRKA